MLSLIETCSLSVVGTALLMLTLNLATGKMQKHLQNSAKLLSELIEFSLCRALTLSFV